MVPEKSSPDLLDHLRAELDLSGFLAGGGARPAAIEVPDPAAVGRVIARLCAATTHEVLSLHDPGVSAVETTPADEVRAKRADRDLVRRRVRVRQVVARADPTSPDGSDGDWASVRTAPLVPFKLTVFDRSVALLALNAGAKTLHHGALVVRDPAVVGTLVAAAHSAWTMAEPLRSDDPVPDHLRPVLAALLDGLVDEAAARRLSMSRRTYSRRVADLLRVLGVRSRAQAGAAAARRGWRP